MYYCLPAKNEISEITAKLSVKTTSSISSTTNMQVDDFAVNLLRACKQSLNRLIKFQIIPVI